MIRPHRLRTLHSRAVTNVDTGRNLHRTFEHGIASHSGIRIDRRGTANASAAADDGPLANDAERVETRPVGYQRVGANQAQVADDDAGADSGARQQRRVLGNPRRRMDGDARLGKRRGTIQPPQPEAAQQAPAVRRASRNRRQPKNPNPSRNLVERAKRRTREPRVAAPRETDGDDAAEEHGPPPPRQGPTRPAPLLDRLRTAAGSNRRFERRRVKRSAERRTAARVPHARGSRSQGPFRNTARLGVEENTHASRRQPGDGSRRAPVTIRVVLAGPSS